MYAHKLAGFASSKEAALKAAKSTFTGKTPQILHFNFLMFIASAFLPIAVEFVFMQFPSAAISRDYVRYFAVLGLFSFGFAFTAVFFNSFKVSGT
jgi:hypothetical protein